MPAETIQGNSNARVTKSVIVRYLEMRSPTELRPRRAPRGDVTFARIDPPWPELNRFFYTNVGGGHYWVDRLPWTREQWLAQLSRPELETWVLADRGLPAGYVELEKQSGGSVELVYFGLLARFAGQGLGAHLLTCATERAWATGASRVWLHTCSLDHPAALPNYIARGFREVRVETVDKELPRQPPDAWPALD